MHQVRGVCGLIRGAKLGTEARFEMTHILFGRTVRGILQGDSVPKDFLPQLIDLYRKGQFPSESWSAAIRWTRSPRRSREALKRRCSR